MWLQSKHNFYKNNSLNVSVVNEYIPPDHNWYDTGHIPASDAYRKQIRRTDNR